MKKLLALAALGALCGMTSADDLQDNVGIGLGTLIFKGHDGLVSQVSAATTNGIYGNQTFAITSGTCGAKKPATLVRNETLNQFIAANMDKVAQDIALGQGEALDTVVELLAIPSDRQDGYRQKVQASFASIYSSEKVTHLDVVKALQDLANS